MRCQDVHYTRWSPCRFHVSGVHCSLWAVFHHRPGQSPMELFVSIDRCSPEKIPHSRIIIGGKIFVHGNWPGSPCINRIEGDTFIGFSIHELIKGFPFQKCIAGIHPFFPSWWCKFIKFNCWKSVFPSDFLRISSSSLSVSCLTGSWDFCSSMNFPPLKYLDNFTNTRDSPPLVF